MRFSPGPPTPTTKIIEAVNSGLSAGLYQLIAETGNGLARGQEALNAAQLSDQQARAAYLRNNGDPAMLPPASAYAVPEATLDLRVALHASASTQGTVELMGTPINPASASKADMSLAIAGRVKVRYALVPPVDRPDAASPPSAGGRPPAHSPDEAIALGRAELERVTSEKGLLKATIRPEYRDESGKWELWLMSGGRAVAVLLVDDANGAHDGLLDLSTPLPPVMEMLRDPTIDAVRPTVAGTGHRVTITGTNLTSGLWDNTHVFVGGREARIISASFGEIVFEVDARLRSGDVRVETWISSSTALDATARDPLTISATPTGLSPTTGYYDDVQRRGSIVRVAGHNLSEGTELRFTGGASVLPSTVADDGATADYEVPDGAKNGTITLVTKVGVDELLVELAEPAFRLRPFVRDVHPKEARAGERVVLRGSHLNGISDVQIGARRFSVGDASGAGASVVRMQDRLEFTVPPDAGDGELRLFAGDILVPTGIFFLQVPSDIVLHGLAIQGKDVELSGLGLGRDRASLRVRFPRTGGGFTYVTPHFVESDPDAAGRSRANITIPSDAATGRAMVLRAEVASYAALEATTARTETPVPVWSADTPDEVILWDDVTWSGWESVWTERAVGGAGAAAPWSLQFGTLLSDGVDLLALTTDLEPESAFHFWGEVEVDSSATIVLRANTAGNYVTFELWPTRGIAFFGAYDANGRLEVVTQGGLAANPSSPRHRYFVSIHATASGAQAWVNGVAYSLPQWPAMAGSPNHLPGLGASKGARWSWVAVAKEDRLVVPAYADMDRADLRPLARQRSRYAVRKLSRDRGVAGDVITVDGSGFDAGVRLIIGDQVHTVLMQTPVSLQFGVGPIGVSGPLVVEDTSDASNRSEEAHRFVIHPRIATVTPVALLPEQDVRISGSNLAAPGVQPIVRWNDVVLEIVDASAELVTARVPEEIEAGTGLVSVEVPGSDVRASYATAVQISVPPTIRSLDRTPLAGQSVRVPFEFQNRLYFQHIAPPELVPEWRWFDGAQVVSVPSLPTTITPANMFGYGLTRVGDVAYLTNPFSGNLLALAKSGAVESLGGTGDLRSDASSGIAFSNTLYFRGTRTADNQRGLMRIVAGVPKRVEAGASGYTTEFREPVVFNNKLYFAGSPNGMYSFDGTTMVAIPKGASGYTAGFQGGIVFGTTPVLYFLGGTNVKPRTNMSEFQGIMAMDTANVIRTVPNATTDYVGQFMFPVALGTRLCFFGTQYFTQPPAWGGVSLYLRLYVVEGGSVKSVSNGTSGYLTSAEGPFMSATRPPLVLGTRLIFGGFTGKVVDGATLPSTLCVFTYDGTAIRRPDVGSSGYASGYDFPFVCGGFLYFKGIDLSGKPGIFECDGVQLRRVTARRSAGFVDDYLSAGVTCFGGRAYFQGSGPGGGQTFGLW